MAVVYKSLSTMADILAAAKKKDGDGIGSYGGALKNSERVPTGLFPFDIALGGGFPRGQCSIVYGPESSGKTNCVLLAIANHQKMWPDKTNVFFDVEYSFDPAWAKLLGVDTDKLIVIKPSFAEQVVDLAEAFLLAEGCGIVAIDSLAALVTANEASSSAEKANVGGASLITGKLARKTTLAMGEAEKMGRLPTLIYINQTRFKVGVMFGDPETMPGGNAPRFQATLWIRVYGKNVIDSKISQVMPIAKEVTFVVKKYKTPILAVSGKYEMVTIPHDGLGIGETDDFTTIQEYLKSFGMFFKGEKDKGWVILGDPYSTIQEFKDRVYQDKKFGYEVRDAVISKLLADNTLMMNNGEVE